MYMSNKPLTFNDLPQVVAELRDNDGWTGEIGLIFTQKSPASVC